MTSPRLSLVLSLLVHGAALGTACIYGGGAAAPRRPVHIELHPSEAAMEVVETPPIEALVVQQNADEPPLSEAIEPEALEPDVPVDPAAFEPATEPIAAAPQDLPPALDWLASFKPRPAVVPIAVPVPIAPAEAQTSAPVPPAPAALVLEIEPGTNTPPAYPWLARRRGWQGVVAIFVHVDGAGAVTAAAIARSSGYAVLDEAAVQAVRQWHFRGGAGETTVEVEFRLRS